MGAINILVISVATATSRRKMQLHQLEQLGLSGENIVIEITENLLLNAESNVIDKLYHFRDAGIQVAIDDFGTGYSSLAYLKKFEQDLKTKVNKVAEYIDPAQNTLDYAIMFVPNEAVFSK